MSKNRRINGIMAIVLGVIVAFSGTFTCLAADTVNTGQNTTAPTLEEGTYVEHEVLVLYQTGSGIAKADAASRELMSDSDTLAKVSTDAAVESLENISKKEADAIEASGAAYIETKDIKKSAKTEVRLVRDESMTTAELIEKLSKDPHVIAVEPNWISADQTEGEPETAPAADGHSYQWEINNDGKQFSSGKDADMRFTAARKQQKPTGIEDVVVAVIDSGVDGEHNDLNLWTDPGDIGLMGNYEGADLHGYDSGGGSSYADIEREHGTHVAGIVGALWNGVGTSGIAPNARIMSVHHRDRYNSFVQCFEYVKAACEAGVKVRVTNNSWGGGSYTAFIMDALIRELGEKYGVVSVFSAGNSSTDDDEICCVPSTLVQNPYVIVVGAAGPDGKKASFSSWGYNTVDIFAPGVQILSTLLTESSEGEMDCPYIGELDPEKVMLQSFDESSQNPLLTFDNLVGTELNTKYVYAGTKSLHIPSSSMTKEIFKEQTQFCFSSDPINLSGVTDKPEYLGFKVYTDTSPGELGFGHCTIRTTDGEQTPMVVDATSFSSSKSWGNVFCELPENTDWNNFQITLAVNVIDHEKEITFDDFDLYLDNMIMGSNCYPYTYSSGTSMAGPMVTGEAAVVCGMYPEASAEEIIARILSGTDQSDDISFEGLCTTGEMANVDRAIGKEVNLAPYISNAVLEDDGTVSLEGWFITEDCTAKAQTEKGGSFQNLRIVEKITGKQGKVRVEIPKDFSGEIWFTLSNGNGRSPVKYAKFGISKNINTYDECDIEIPEDVNSLLSRWDGWNSTAYNGYLYFLHQTHATIGTPESSMEEIIRYNVSDKAWQIMKIPKELILEHDGEIIFSYAATEHKGKLYVLVSSTYKVVNPLNPEDIVDMQDTTILTLDEHDRWEKKNRLPFPESNYTLLSENGELFTVGGGNYSIYKWDDAAQTFVSCGNCSRQGPEAVMIDGSMILGGGNNGATAEESLPGVDIFRYRDDYEQYDLVSSVDFSECVKSTRNQHYGIAKVDGGIVAVGPRSIDGMTDTYFIPYSRPADGQEPKLKAQMYSKTAYDAPIYRPTAIAYRDKLYVLAAIGDGDRHVFSATYFKTAPNPTPTPDPVKTGDSNEAILYILLSVLALLAVSIVNKLVKGGGSH